MRENERERLYYLFQESKCPMHFLDNKEILDTVDYLLENGVVVPPCKVGTRVYSIALGKVYEWDICSYTVDLEGISFINLAFVEGNNLYSNTYSIEDIGKTVFLTREEAERALKGGAE